MDVVIILLFFAVITSLIGSRKGEGISGFFVGLIFGPLGIIIALYTQGNRIKCTSCKELINKDATRCPKCTSSVSKS